MTEPPEFEPIRRRAVARIGAAELAARLPPVKDAATLAATPDDRYLSDLARRIFRAGLKHSLVDAKWPNFEAAFHGFVPGRVGHMPDEELEALMSDRGLIRHWGKLRAVRDNAAELTALSDEHGGFGRLLADWPGGRIVELWALLAKRFRHLGGDSAPRFLRMAGKDTFILTPSVLKVLHEIGAIDDETAARRIAGIAQTVFGRWAAETGLPLAHLSMIAAASVDE
jgi:3-methyladenine DNA glycosylase Tag